MTTKIQDILQASPRVIFTCDNLPVLRGMNSETVDLIYLDPPFNSGKKWANPVKAVGRRAMAEFKDTWETSDIHIDERYALGQEYPSAVGVIDALGAVHGNTWKAYLIYMGVRLAEMHRILKPTGSIYYHCDPVMSHGVKLLMDAIFGKRNFCNEIVWHYTNASRGKRKFAKAHDVILWYGKSNKYAFNRDDVLAPYMSGMTAWRFKQKGKPPPKGKTPDDVITIPSLNTMSIERTGYPTQKPLALLEQLVKAGSKKGDIVLDPFCGCATTCLAAERWGRHWIGVDLSEAAANLVVDRLKKESDRELVAAADGIKHFYKSPQRTDLRGRRSRDGAIKSILHLRQRGICPGCDRRVEIDFMDLDHIIARARGGQDVDDNLQLLCRKCNTMKGDKGMDTLRRKVLHKRAEEDMRKWREKQEAKRKRDMPEVD